MADLAFAPRYNMVAYLEKTENNAEFHQIVNFHRSSSIHYALTGEGSGSGPGYQETMQGAIAQVKHEGASIQSIDLPLSTCHTVRSGEDRMEREFELADLVPQTPHDSPLSGGYTPGEVIVEDKGSGEKGGSTAETVSTTRTNISATRPENQKAKEKGVTFEDTDDSARPIRSITTLQPLPTIDPKDKGSKEDEKRTRSRKKRAAGSSSKQKSPKKQKVNDQESDDSDKELRKCLKMAPDYDKPINYETLDVKSPIVDYESQVLGTMVAGNVHVYKLTRLDKSYKHFSTFSRILEVLYRQDVLDLHKIVMEKFPDSDPEEKRYPLTKEILEKIISWRLEAKTESTLALDLIKFIKLLLEEK
nr:hypothetical protein [Tanacetum cinerariifolium]